MQKFYSLVKFPLIVFVLLEILFFLIGFFFMRTQALCKPCPPAPAICPPCLVYHQGFELLAIGFVPSLIVAIVIYILIRRRK